MGQTDRQRDQGDRQYRQRGWQRDRDRETDRQTKRGRDVVRLTETDRQKYI